jgi:hypothetical protein
MTVLPFYFSADFATTSAAEICVDASFNSLPQSTDPSF